MKIIAQAFVLSIFISGPVVAQDLVFHAEDVAACLEGATGGDRRDCIGVAADACMIETPGGSSTVAMGGCLSRELEVWDGMLNAAYGDLMALYAANDAEARAGGWNAPEQVPALKAMQRAWITYRDARCDFERAKWGGGTGQGPATAQCLMQLTAEQTFVLQDGMDGLQ